MSPLSAAKLGQRGAPRSMDSHVESLSPEIKIRERNRTASQARKGKRQGTGGFTYFSLALSLLFLLLLWPPSARGELGDPRGEPREGRVPILAYHRFGPVASDSMTVTTPSFDSQLKYLRENHFTVIRLRQLLDFQLGKKQPLPSRSVVLTVDDGHKSVYTDLLPLLKKYQAPATLFLYPSAISNASYAMTWDQVRELKETGLFDLQSHTFWHPNFKNEKKRLKPTEYQSFVDTQLKKSKERLERELQVKVDVLAWPFGIYDDELMNKAMMAGYVAALSIDRRHVRSVGSRNGPSPLSDHERRPSFPAWAVRRNRAGDFPERARNSMRLAGI